MAASLKSQNSKGGPAYKKKISKKPENWTFKTITAQKNLTERIWIKWMQVVNNYYHLIGSYLDTRTRVTSWTR